MNIEILKYVEENMNEIDKLECMIRYKDEISHETIIEEIKKGEYAGCEYILPLFMMYSENNIIRSTTNQIFLKMIIDKIEQNGNLETINEIANILKKNSKNNFFN